MYYSTDVIDDDLRNVLELTDSQMLHLVEHGQLASDVMETGNIAIGANESKN